MNDTMFATGIRHSAWVPVASGGLCGVLTGIGQALALGLPESILMTAVLDGVVGLVLGVVSMALVLLIATLSNSRVATLAVALPVSAGLAALASWPLTRGFLWLPMLLTALATVLAHVIAGARAATRPERVPTVDDSGSSRTTRILILVGGGILAVVASVGAVGMLREQLHVGCAYGTMGEAAGAWMCADGIGYIFPGLALLFGSGLPLLIALLVLLVTERESTRRRTLTILAFVPLLWSFGWLSSATLARTDPLPDGETWLGIWLVSVGVSLVLAVVGVTVATFAPSHPGRAARLLWVVGGSFVLAATIVQPGLALATIAAAALAAAARLVPVSAQDAFPARKATEVSVG